MTRRRVLKRSLAVLAPAPGSRKAQSGIGGILTKAAFRF